MRRAMKTACILVTGAFLCLAAYLVHGALERMSLVRPFSLLGIEVDTGALVIVIALIPAWWIVGVLVKTWSVK